MEETQKIKCPFCNKTISPDIFQEMWDVEILIEAKCPRCRMILGRKWKPLKGHKFQHIKEILKEMGYI